MWSWASYGLVHIAGGACKAVAVDDMTCLGGREQLHRQPPVVLIVIGKIADLLP